MVKKIDSKKPHKLWTTCIKFIWDTVASYIIPKASKFSSLKQRYQFWLDRDVVENKDKITYATAWADTKPSTNGSKYYQVTRISIMPLCLVLPRFSYSQKRQLWQKLPNSVEWEFSHLTNGNLKPMLLPKHFI